MLGQSGGGSYGAVALWGGLLIGAAVIGGVVWMSLRRRLFDDGESAVSVRSLLDELEASRRSGLITEEEFQRARNSLLGITPGGGGGAGSRGGGSGGSRSGLGGRAGGDVDGGRGVERPDTPG